MRPRHPAKGLFPNVMAELIGRRVDLSEPKSGRSALALGGVAAILASTCCLGPLVLVALGFSGAWIGNLTALEPYQPIFAGVSLAFIGFGAWRLRRKRQVACADGYCATPQSDRIAKIGLWTAATLVVLAVGFPYVARYFL